MRTALRHVTALALGLALLAPVPCEAGKVPENALYLGLFGGGHLTIDKWSLGEANKIASAGDLRPSALGGLRLGVQATRWLGIEVTAAMIPTTARGGDSQLALSWGGSVILQPFQQVLSPYLGLGGGMYHTLGDGAVGSDDDYQIHATFGLRSMLTKWMALRVEAKNLWTDGEGRPGYNIALTGGLDFMLWRTADDRDKDGLPDDEDACPADKGPRNTMGCPDGDGDGIADKDDKCPADPGMPLHEGCPDRDADGLIDGEDECPDAAGPVTYVGCPDTDGDTLIDKDDSCPQEAGTKELKGCPDTDGDGLIDREDRCPKEPGPKERNGCPDQDNDGILDKDDKCPKQPGVAELHGCPPPKKELKRFTGAIKGIYFKSGSAKILEKSFPVLNEAAAVLLKYKTVRVQIEGHTDDQGKAKSNQKLSRLRAEAVREHLIGRGVGAERLVAVGFGEDKPVASNKSKRGRAKNRRIEFTIIGR